MKNKRLASFTWSRANEEWVLRLWIDNKWEFSKSWPVKDQNQDNDTAYVNDSIMVEIANLLALGYRVTIDL